jgi:uncharacterized protein YukE
LYAKFLTRMRSCLSDVKQLRADLDGCRRAYEALQSEVGSFRRDRDGYRQAYETLQSEVGSFRRDRDGYRQAYETLQSEVGQLRRDCDGFRQAYETLQSEVGQLRRDRDGFRQAYETAEAEIGSLINAGALRPRSKEQLSAAAGLPSILVVTLPRSGTVYIGSTLERTLGYQYGSQLFLGHLHKNVIVARVAREFKRGGTVCTTHMQPDNVNINALRRFGITKGILQTRDPRASLQSWIHFYAKEKLHNLLDPHLDGVYSSMSDEEKFEHHFQEFYLPAVSWLSDWISCLEQNNDLEFLVLDYADLASNEQDFFNKILNFYNLAAPLKAAPRNDSTHFRTAPRIPWNEEFTADQIDRLNSAIPDPLWKKFAWAAVGSPRV